MNCGDRTTGGGKPLGFAAIGIFLFFGGAMAGLAATTLLLPGTPLDRAWSLNPTAYQQLSPLGRKVGILFLLLAVVLVLSESDGSKAVSGDGDLPSLLSPHKCLETLPAW
jgi:hypothetical protein